MMEMMGISQSFVRPLIDPELLIGLGRRREEGLEADLGGESRTLEPPLIFFLR